MNTRMLQQQRLFSGYTRLVFLLIASFFFTAILVYLAVDSIQALKGNFMAVNVSILLTLCLLGLTCYLLIQEIKRRKKLTIRLKQQKDNLHTILNSISEGLIATNAKGEVLFANEAAQSLSGYRFSEMKQKPVDNIFKNSNDVTAGSISNMINQVLANGLPIAQENHTIVNSKTNQKMVITNSGAPLTNSSGKINGAVLVFSDLTEIAAKEEVLKNKDKQFLDLIKNMPQAMYTCDDWGYIQVYNKAAAEMWGWEPIPGKDQWCGWHKIFDPITGDEIAAENCPMAKTYKEKKPVYGAHLRVQRPDGSERLVASFPSPLFNNEGKMTGAVNMLIDITEKNEKETIIRKTEEKYRSLIEQASDPILIYSLDGTIHEFNKTTCTYLGYSAEELSTLKLQDLLFNEPVIANEKIAEKIKAGDKVIFKRKFKRKDGTSIITEISSRKLQDGKVLAIVRDITEQIKSEKATKQALELYDMIAQATSDTIWDWDIINQKMRYNKGMEKMFGYAVTEVGNIHDWWQLNLHPDDRERINMEIDILFTEKKHQAQMEYRYRCADNTYKNILDRAFVFFDENGKPMRMIGAMQDITSQKLEEMHINKAIIDTQELERQQMGMELHDNVNQILSASLIYLNTLDHINEGQEDFGEVLGTGKRLVAEAIGEIRRLSHQLAPASFENISIQDVVSSLLRTVKAADKFETNLSFEGNTFLIKGEIRTNLYRIMQEQINNIIKYADATKLEICVEVMADSVRLKIADNGKGFDPRKVTGGIGLENIKRRVRLYNGKFQLRSTPGNGCEIMALLPLKSAKRA
jgi:two-component system, NarL family, sensor histidine kinase UhpB